MELVHDFTVPVPADQAYALLVDLEKVGPCMPGAVITSVDGDSFEGGMKIKLGPIGMTFKGDGELVEKDPAAGRAVIQARGRDAKGNGGAQATVTANLTERGGVTDVHVVTDLNVTGKAAQFGGGVMRDVSNRMLAQFAANLEGLITSGGSAAVQVAAPRTVATAPATTRLAPPQQAEEAGIDAFGLLLGQRSLTTVLRPVLIAVTSAALGYLYGKNRMLERMVRRAG